MVDVLSGTADKKDQNFYYLKETFCFYKLQDSSLKKVIKVSPPPLFNFCFVRKQISVNIW